MSGITTERDALVMRLEDEIARLRRELADKDALVDQERRAFQIGVNNLRRVLTPLHVGLLQVFGEMEAVATEAGPSSASTGPMPEDRIRRVWDEWKAKLPSSCGRVIDALLIHGELKVTQMTVAAKISINTLRGGDGVIAKLNRAGLLVNNDGRYSLKTF